MKYVIWFSLLVISSSSFSASCKKLTECISLSEKFTGKKVIYDKNIIPDQFELNRPIDINTGNIDQAFSEALNVFGLSRIPAKVPGVVQIIKSRDVRFRSDLPSFEASKKRTPDLPNTHDPISLTYRGLPDSDPERIAEAVEPLLSRYGKVVPLRGGIIIVSDLASQVQSILPVIQGQDFPLTKAEKDKIMTLKKREHDLEMARLKAGKMHETMPHKH